MYGAEEEAGLKEAEPVGREPVLRIDLRQQLRYAIHVLTS